MASFLLGGIGSLIGGLFGMGAAAKAAKADQQAGSTIENAGQNVQNFTKQQLAASTGELNPYVSAGQNAFSSVGSLMQDAQRGQGPLASWTGQFQAPTAAQAEATPGYQFQLQQGMNALQDSAAASGGLLSEGTGKRLEQYGQGLASTNYQQVYNNAMQQYQQQYQQFQNNQNNLYGRLMGIGQAGLGAAQTSVGANMQGAQLYGNEGLTAAQGQAGYQAQAGGAKAIGLAGMGNSIGNAMGSFAGMIPQSQPNPGATMSYG
jgi:hypothetical protein